MFPLSKIWVVKSTGAVQFLLVAQAALTYHSKGHSGHYFPVHRPTTAVCYVPCIPLVWIYSHGHISHLNCEILSIKWREAANILIDRILCHAEKLKWGNLVNWWFHLTCLFMLVYSIFANMILDNFQTLLNHPRNLFKFNCQSFNWTIYISIEKCSFRASLNRIF